MKLFMPVLTLAVFWAGAMTAGEAGQDVAISVRSDLVVVPVTVKDSEGRLVDGLTEEDFVIEEDGERQTIAQFSAESMPISAVILIDAGVEEKSLEAIQKSVPVLEEILGEGDEVAVYRYDNRVREMLDFTTDPAALRGALERLRELSPKEQFTRGGAPMPSPVVNGVPLIPTAPIPVTRVRHVLHDAVSEAARSLRSRPQERRRVILLISDGHERGSEATFEDNEVALMEAEIQVYALGLGMNVVSNFMTPLDNYAGFSGGSFYRRSLDEVQKTILQIGEQARNQYTLAYVSTHQPPPETVVLREIEVRLDGPYEVIHKHSYYQVP